MNCAKALAMVTVLYATVSGPTLSIYPQNCSISVKVVDVTVAMKVTVIPTVVVVEFIVEAKELAVVER
jgi:hypothetical protein